MVLKKFLIFPWKIKIVKSTKSTPRQPQDSVNMRTMQEYRFECEDCPVEGKKMVRSYMILSRCKDGDEVTEIYENGKLKSLKINNVEQLSELTTATNRRGCIIM